MRYGNDQSRAVLSKILDYHQEQEKPLFVLLSGEEGLGKTSFLYGMLKEFLGDFAYQDLLFVRDCTQELEKTHTLAIETPSASKTIPLQNGEVYDNKGVREMSAWLQQSAFSGKKCLLIENLERMSNAAMNAFLKTCEEPLKHRFIFATVSDESAILPTIFSRALLVRFAPLSSAQMKEFLVSKYPHVSLDLVDVVVKVSRGRSGLGLTLLEKLQQDSDLANYFVNGFNQFLEETSQYLRLQYLKKIQELGMLDLIIDALIAHYAESGDDHKIVSWIAVKKMKNQAINDENLLWYGIVNS